MPPVMPSDDDLIHRYGSRLGEENVRRRLQGEAIKNEKYGPKNRFHDKLAFAFKAMRLYARGLRNACDLTTTSQQLSLASLPATLSGLRIAHLSDWHCGLDQSLDKALIRALGQIGTNLDVIVFTGDFIENLEHMGGYDALENALRTLTSAHPQTPLFAVLGNHDTLRLAPLIEEAGVTLLLNEAAPFEHRGETFWIVGVEDPTYFKADDFGAALKDVPDGAPKLLLCHSPKRYEQFARYGFDAVLCGHVHGGQICLPTLHDVWLMAVQRRDRLHDTWPRVLGHPLALQLSTRDCRARADRIDRSELIGWRQIRLLPVREW